MEGCFWLETTGKAGRWQNRSKILIKRNGFLIIVWGVGGKKHITRDTTPGNPTHNL